MPEHARIAIIGTGWWSSIAHLPVLAAHSAAQITAICHTREEVLAWVTIAAAPQDGNAEFNKDFNKLTIDLKGRML